MSRDVLQRGLNANSQVVTGIPTPVNPTEAVPKSYVDACVATWPLDTRRFYAVDYDNGSDANVGYSDVSMADAGTKALKTLEHLRLIFPRNGNGRLVTVVIRARTAGATYLKQDGVTVDDLDLQGMVGYRHILIRGTGTVASAGAVAFADDNNDKFCAGAMLVVGTNAAGYKTASVSTSAWDVTKASGAAAALAAEPGLSHKRVRFDVGSTNPNFCSGIWKNTSTHIDISDNIFGLVPDPADIFYIEQPGVAVGEVRVSSSEPGLMTIVPDNYAGQQTDVALNVFGIRGVTAGGGVRCTGGRLRMAFCEADVAQFNSYEYLSFNDAMQFTEDDDTNTGLGEGGLTFVGGPSFRAATSFSVIKAQSAAINSWYALGLSLRDCPGLSVGTGSHVGTVAIANCGQNGATGSTSATIGGDSSSLAGLRSGTVDWSDSSGEIAAAVEGNPASGITIKNINTNVPMHVCVNSTGAASQYGLNAINCHGSTILIGSAPTGGTADVRLPGPVNLPLSYFTTSDYWDKSGNHTFSTGSVSMQGALGPVASGTTNISPSSVVTLATFTRLATQRVSVMAFVSTTGAGNAWEEQSDVATNTGVAMRFERTANANEAILKARNGDAGTRTIDWTIMGFIP